MPYRLKVAHALAGAMVGKVVPQDASLTEPRHHQPPAPHPSYPLPQAHARMGTR